MCAQELKAIDDSLKPMINGGGTFISFGQFEVTAYYFDPLFIDFSNFGDTSKVH